MKGTEKRKSLLPNSAPSGIGALGSSYNPANAMKRPDELDIKVGNSMDDVVKSVKGIGFYVDQMAFGAPSTGLTNGMPLKPLGVNYFMNTGQVCSNGAAMWQYIQGIPDGSALGENVQNAMAGMGLPPLQGLAPGMLEDMEHALNPSPIMNALFGSGYPECKLAKDYVVGDAYGRIRDPTTGEDWISDPDSVVCNNGVCTQTKWIQNTDYKNNPISLTKENYDAAKKEYNLNGTEKFQNMHAMMTRPATIAVVGVLCLIAFSFIKR